MSVRASRAPIPGRQVARVAADPAPLRMQYLGEKSGMVWNCGSNLVLGRTRQNCVVLLFYAIFCKDIMILWRNIILIASNIIAFWRNIMLPSPEYITKCLYPARQSGVNPSIFHHSVCSIHALAERCILPSRADRQTRPLHHTPRKAPRRVSDRL